MSHPEFGQRNLFGHMFNRGYTVPTFAWRDSMKCPDCQQYSLTYDFMRNGWWCHVYNGFIRAEDMP